MPGWNREVNQTTIDGVPVIWAEAPGPIRATLMFRVGRVDERLPWSGITHLVEHLMSRATTMAPPDFLVAPPLPLRSTVPGLMPKQRPRTP